MRKKTYIRIHFAVLAVWILLTIAIGVLLWYSDQNVQLQDTVHKLVKGYTFSPVVLCAIRVLLKSMVKE